MSIQGLVLLVHFHLSYSPSIAYHHYNLWELISYVYTNYFNHSWTILSSQQSEKRSKQDQTETSYIFLMYHSSFIEPVIENYRCWRLQQKSL